MATYRRADHFTQKAKASGYPARSVYKLEEIDRRAQLLKKGMRVLDLGASPGSWSLYVSTKVGQQGRLLAVDLKPLKQALPRNCTFVQGDAFGVAADTLAMYGPYDVVLSDMAPNTSGSRIANQARSYGLFCHALDTAIAMGKEGSSFCAKIFMGPDFPEAKEKVRKAFSKVKVMRPEGVRSNSFEIFVVGLKKRSGPSYEAPTAEAEPQPLAAPPALAHTP